MSARRQPSQEDQLKLLEDERARMRKIGVRAIVGLVAVLIVVTVALQGGSKDSPTVLIVFADDAEDRADVDKDEFVRVTGTMRRAIDDSRYDSDSANALFASRVTVSKPSDSTSGLTPVSKLRGDDVQLGQKVTVVGKVESVNPNSTVLAISEPD